MKQLKISTQNTNILKFGHMISPQNYLFMYKLEQDKQLFKISKSLYSKIKAVNSCHIIT